MKFYIAFASLALGISAATPIAAQTYQITYQGIVGSGHDSTGEFGAANTSLTGLSYTASYELILPPPPGSVVLDNGLDYIIRGGQYLSKPDFLSGTLTINGSTFAVGGDWYGSFRQFNGTGVPAYGGDGIEVGIEDYSTAIRSSPLGSQRVVRENILFNYLGGPADFVPVSNIVAPLTFQAQLGDTSYGSFQISDDIGPTIRRASGSLRPTSVTVSLLGSVPEPSTWMLMIIGFGATAFAMRSRPSGPRMRVSYS